MGWIDAALVDYGKLGPLLALNTAKYIGSTISFITLAIMVNYGQASQVASYSFAVVAFVSATVLLVMYLL